MTDRRTFLKQSAALVAGTAAVGACAPGGTTLAPAPQAAVAQSPAGVRELLMGALDAARSAGATYADVRVQRQQQNFVSAREQQIQNVVDTDSIGIGVRTLVDGTWGFAATRLLTRDGAVAAAREAVAVARASRVAGDPPVEWLPAPVHRDVSWNNGYRTDPWEIALEEKAELLLRANGEAMKVQGVRFVNSGLAFVKEERNYANTDGSVIAQTVVRCAPSMTITAVAPTFTDFQTRGNVVPPMARGWEYVLESDLAGNAPRWAGEAVEKLAAKPVEVGRYDLILDPSNLWLTIHENIGHPTELDRAMGYEANYAGTSFLAPPERVLGQMRYGPEWMNVQGDRSQEGALSTIGYDDDGVRPDEFLIVKNGMFNDYQTTREQAPWLRWWYERQGMPVRSHGCSYAQGWNNVQFQRMPNVSLLPGERDLSRDDLVAATDRGILIVGDGSFSIDQQRYNAQFGGQLFYEIRGGRVTGMLKDVAYQIRTPDFWSSMDMIGGRSSYRLGGSFNDGKGQPSQSNAVSHGCPPARFRNTNVINTGRTA
jgi:TldD protein